MPRFYPSNRKKRTPKPKGGLENESESNSNSSTPNVVINLPLVSKWFTSRTHRRLLKTRYPCNCWLCLDTGIQYNYEVEMALQEEIKATQKSIAHCKEDTNKILSKVQKLEALFQ